MTLLTGQAWEGDWASRGRCLLRGRRRLPSRAMQRPPRGPAVTCSTTAKPELFLSRELAPPPLAGVDLWGPGTAKGSAPRHTGRLHPGGAHPPPRGCDSFSASARMTKATDRGRRPGLSHSQHRGTSPLLSGFRVPGSPSVGWLPQQTWGCPGLWGTAQRTSAQGWEEDAGLGPVPASSSGPAFPTATRHRAS